MYRSQGRSRRKRPLDLCPQELARERELNRRGQETAHQDCPDASELEYREIMADLECDWYVSLDTATNEYYFLLDIMRAWWQRFYPALKPKRK